MDRNALAAFIDDVWIGRWGHSQAELARRVGVAESRLSEWKHGRCRPTDWAVIEGLRAQSWCSESRTFLLAAEAIAQGAPA